MIVAAELILTVLTDDFGLLRLINVSRIRGREVLVPGKWLMFR